MASRMLLMSCKVFDTQRISYVSAQQALPVHLRHILLLKSFAKGAGNGLNLCVDSITGLQDGSSYALYHCSSLQVYTQSIQW